MIRELNRKHPYKPREGRRELFSPQAPGKRAMLWLSIAVAIPGWKQLPRGTSRLGAATWAALCPQPPGLWWSSLFIREKNRELRLKRQRLPGCLPWRIGSGLDLTLQTATASTEHFQPPAPTSTIGFLETPEIYFPSPQRPVNLSGFPGPCSPTLLEMFVPGSHLSWRDKTGIKQGRASTQLLLPKENQGMFTWHSRAKSSDLGHELGRKSGPFLLFPTQFGWVTPWNQRWQRGPWRQPGVQEWVCFSWSQPNSPNFTWLWHRRPFFLFSEGKKVTLPKPAPSARCQDTSRENSWHKAHPSLPHHLLPCWETEVYFYFWNYFWFLTVLHVWKAKQGTALAACWAFPLQHGIKSCSQWSVWTP